MSCPDLETIGRALEARADDSLAAPDEHRLRAHLRTCAECSAAGLAEDPTTLFLSLAADNDVEPLQGGRSRSLELDSQSVVRDVMASLEIERARRRLQPSRRPALLRAASLALLGGVLLAILIARGQIPFVSPSALAPRNFQARVVLPPTPGRTNPTAASMGSREPTVGEREATFRRPLIENLENPGARVYQFASDSKQEPNVVFVVDRNADL